MYYKNKIQQLQFTLLKNKNKLFYNCFEIYIALL